jgi:dTDP-4-amino-4,6-dideoxygalactose transaminase
VLGDEVEQFEREFAAYSGAEYGVGVSSGTAALQLALVAAGAGPGDEVITVPFTFAAMYAAIEYTGARPVLVDVDPVSLTMDPNAIEPAVTSRTKAIVPVHLYGQPADMDPIVAAAKRHGLAVIEDAAQAHGARYRGRPAGSLGDLGCFSFYPSKNLGAYGEGGLVTTNRAEYAERLRLLRNWGEQTKYAHAIRGFNARLQGLQGAVLRVKLRHLDAWNEARRARAAEYASELRDTALQLPVEMPYARHVYHLYTVRSARRAELESALRAAGVQTGRHYPVPVHLQPAYRDERYPARSFPVSERAAGEVLSLPMFPTLTREQVGAVSDAVREAEAAIA